MSTARSVRAGAGALAVVVCAMGSASAHGASQSIVRWKTSEGGNGHWYRAVQFTPGVNWETASTIAQQQGGYLATMCSSAENSFVYDLIDEGRFWRASTTIPFPKYEGPWIGGVQAPNAATAASGWGWVTGESFTFSAWGYMQPNDAAGAASQDRLQFWSRDSMSPTWQDVQGSYAAPSFIIEYDTMPAGARDRVKSLFGALQDSLADRVPGEPGEERPRRPYFTPKPGDPDGGGYVPGGFVGPGGASVVPAPGIAGLLAASGTLAGTRRRRGRN